MEEVADITIVDTQGLLLPLNLLVGMCPLQVPIPERKSHRLLTKREAALKRVISLVTPLWQHLKIHAVGAKTGVPKIGRPLGLVSYQSRMEMNL